MQDATEPEKPMTATEVLVRQQSVTDFRHPKAVLHRLQQYCYEVPEGTQINLEALVIDTVTAFKLGGMKKNQLNLAFNEIWRKLQLQANPP